VLEHVLGGAAAALLTAVLMTWVARAFPLRPGLGQGPTLEELAPKYAKWEGVFVAIYIVSWAPVTYGLWLLLQQLSDWNATTLGPAEILITADPWFWTLPAFFLALVLPGAPLTWLAHRLLGPRFAEYDRYLSLKHRMDWARANRVALQVTGWGCALAIFLGLNWYVLVRADALVINRLLGVTEDVHPWASFRSIRTAPRFVAPNGSVKQRRQWLVTFEDGTTWSTLGGLPREQTAAQTAALIAALSARARLPVEEIPVFEKYALW